MEITIKIDQRKKESRALLEFLKNLPFVELDLEKPNVTLKEKSPYNPKFVAMVLKSAKSKKSTVVNTKDIWGSLGLK